MLGYIRSFLLAISAFPTLWYNSSSLVVLQSRGWQATVKFWKVVWGHNHTRLFLEGCRGHNHAHLFASCWGLLSCSRGRGGCLRQRLQCLQGHMGTPDCTDLGIRSTFGSMEKWFCSSANNFELMMANNFLPWKQSYVLGWGWVGGWVVAVVLRFPIALSILITTLFPIRSLQNWYLTGTPFEKHWLY